MSEPAHHKSEVSWTCQQEQPWDWPHSLLPTVLVDALLLEGNVAPPEQDLKLSGSMSVTIFPCAVAQANSSMPESLPLPLYVDYLGKLAGVDCDAAPLELCSSSLFLVRRGVFAVDVELSRTAMPDRSKHMYRQPGLVQPGRQAHTWKDLDSLNLSAWTPVMTLVRCRTAKPKVASMMLFLLAGSAPAACCAVCSLLEALCCLALASLLTVLD